MIWEGWERACWSMGVPVMAWHLWLCKCLCRSDGRWCSLPQTWHLAKEPWFFPPGEVLQSFLVLLILLRSSFASMDYCGKVGKFPGRYLTSDRVSLKNPPPLLEQNNAGWWTSPRVPCSWAATSKSECDFHDFMKNWSWRSLIFFPIYLCFYLRC